MRIQLLSLIRSVRDSIYTDIGTLKIIYWATFVPMGFTLTICESSICFYFFFIFLTLYTSHFLMYHSYFSLSRYVFNIFLYTTFTHIYTSPMKIQTILLLFFKHFFLIIVSLDLVKIWATDFHSKSFNNITKKEEKGRIMIRSL